MTTVSRLSVVLAAACALASPAFADDAAPTRVVYQDTVVVSASKAGLRLADLATTATVISPRQIRLGTARATQDVLASVAGTNVLNLSGSDVGGALEARGFSAQGTTSSMVVLVDGLPINDFETGKVDWSTLVPAQLDHVEFVRGPASFLYGTAAMAGLVQLATIPPADGSRAWGEASGGDHGRGGAAGGLAWGGARVRGSASGAFQRGDGERDHSAWRMANGYGAVRAALTPRWQLTARLLAHQGVQQVPGPLSDPDWRTNPDHTITPDDHHGDHTYDGALELTGQPSAHLDLTAIASGRAVDGDGIETIFPVGAIARESRTRAGGGELRARWSPFGRTMPDVLVGGEYRNGSLVSRYADPAAPAVATGGGDVRRATGAAYALARVPVTARVTLVGGGRVDWLRSSLDAALDGLGRLPNDDLRAISPTAGLSVALPGGGHAWASYAGAFKAPELEQAYDQRPYDFGGGPFHISNTALKPQRGDHWDVGVRAPLPGGAWFDVAAYDARSREELGFDYNTFQIANIARSRHSGLESQLEVTPFHGLSGQFAYAWTRARFVGTHGGHQINTVPEQSGSARLSYEHAAHGALSAEVVLTGRQWIDEEGAYPIAPHAVVNLGLTQAVGAAELFASVRNVADRREPTTGFVSVDAVGDPLPLYFPGAGRSIVAGVRMSRRLSETR